MVSGPVAGSRTAYVRQAALNFGERDSLPHTPRSIARLLPTCNPSAIISSSPFTTMEEAMSRLSRRREPQPKELVCVACRSPMSLLAVEIDIKKHTIFDEWRCTGAIPHVWRWMGKWVWQR